MLGSGYLPFSAQTQPKTNRKTVVKTLEYVHEGYGPDATVYFLSPHGRVWETSLEGLKAYGELKDHTVEAENEWYEQYAFPVPRPPRDLIKRLYRD